MRINTSKVVRLLAGVLAIALPTAAWAAGGDAAWGKAGADDGLRQSFERATYSRTGEGVYPLTAGPAWTQQQEFTVSDGAAKDYVGCSVSVNVDTAVIGAFGRNNQQGSAYVLVRNGTVWTQQQELTASDGAAGDLFGHSVSVSGDTAVIGAFGRSSQSGAAYVFVRSGGVWSQQQELTAPDGRASEAFGVSVSVSGDTAVIGAYNTDSDRGAAYVFVRSGGVWSQQQKLTAADGAASDQFGLSVSVSGDTAVVGALGKNANRGAAYVFSRSGGVWSQQ